MQVQRVQNDLLYRRYFFERAETARRLDGNANEKTRNLVEARRFSRCRLSVLSSGMGNALRAESVTVRVKMLFALTGASLAPGVSASTAEPSCETGRESPSLLGLKFGRVAADLGSEVPRSGPFLPRSGRNHARAARAQRNFRKISYFPLGNSAKFF